MLSMQKWRRRKSNQSSNEQSQNAYNDVCYIFVGKYSIGNNWNWRTNSTDNGRAKSKFHC